MLKRNDGECLLTKEIYEKARKNQPIPVQVDFYDGESNLYIYIYSNERTYAKYYWGNGSDSFCLGGVSEHTIEEIRNLCVPNFQPLPSEEAEEAEAPIKDSKLDQILRRLDKLEKGASC